MEREFEELEGRDAPVLRISHSDEDRVVELATLVGLEDTK